MDCNTPGFPVHHQLPELAPTHIHWVSDAIQPSHPVSSLSPPAFSLSQYQDIYFQMSQFFASGGQRIGDSASASVLPMNIQDWFPLGVTGLISLQSKGPSRVFSNTAVQKYQFLGFQFPCGPALISILTTGKTIALTRWNFIYIFKHMWTHTFVRENFWKGI